MFSFLSNDKIKLFQKGLIRLSTVFLFTAAQSDTSAKISCVSEQLCVIKPKFIKGKVKSLHFQKFCNG